MSNCILYCKPFQGFQWVCSWYTRETHHVKVIRCTLAALDHAQERGKDRLCLQLCTSVLWRGSASLVENKLKMNLPVRMPQWLPAGRQQLSSAFSSGGSKMQTCMSQRSGGKRRESRDKLWEASPKMNPVIKVHLSAVFRRKGSTNIVQTLIWKVAVLQLSSLRPPRPTPYPPASHPTAPATKGSAFSLISTERCSHRSPPARPRRCITPLPRHH